MEKNRGGKVTGKNKKGEGITVDRDERMKVNGGCRGRDEL